MDETYIIIEEDNERKILLEGKETKEAHRETEARYRHLVEPAAAGIDLEAIRRQFMKPAPKTRPEEKDQPEARLQAEEVPPLSDPVPEQPLQRPIEEQVRDLIEKYKSQRPPIFQEEIHPAEPSSAPEAEKDPPDPAEGSGIRYTVLNESDVEILTSDDLPPETDRGPVYVKPLENREAGIDEKTKPNKNTDRSPGGRRFHAPSLLAIAGVAVICLLTIYLIWSI